MNEKSMTTQWYQFHFLKMKNIFKKRHKYERDAVFVATTGQHIKCENFVWDAPFHRRGYSNTYGPHSKWILPSIMLCERMTSKKDKRFALCYDVALHIFRVSYSGYNLALFQKSLEVTDGNFIHEHTLQV